ncbi:MAG TPA: CHAT domain-containing tetratricopeptide repeat protein, partial [Thermoanaerobaculia bacterium]|nr:CHAT domain-containing tetratricopeptide repeat protein [Thermoanaerobaculia bacterium]
DSWEALGRLFKEAGEWSGARESYGRALPLDRILRATRDEAYVENQLGRSAEELEDLAAARGDYQRALGLWRQVGDRENEARTWINLGHILAKRGEAWEALACFDRALANGHEAETRVRALAGRGAARALAGDFQTAFSDLRLALSLVSGHPELRRLVLIELGAAYVEAGAQPLALARFAEALSLERRSGDRYSEAVILNDIGLAHFRRQENGPAFAAYRQAWELFAALGNRRGEATALLNMGWLEAELNHPDRAIESYRRALPMARQLDHRAAEAALHFGMAWAERARHNPRAARAQVETGIAIVETLRGEAARRDLDGSYLATKQDFYSLLVDLRMAEHRTEPLAGHDAEALAVNERARGRALLDALAIRTGASPLAPGEIQQLLGERMLLLEYHLGEKRSFLWVVSAHGRTSFELPARERIESAVRQLFERIEKGDLPRQRGAARQAAFGLSRLLLGPVASLLENRPLLIVPDGALFYVPFAALPDLAAREPEAGPPDVPPDVSPDAWPEPLALRHEVSEIVSASVLAALRQARRGQPTPPGLLANLADPVTDPADPRLPAGAPPARPAAGSYPRLRFSASEAQAIVRLAPAGEVLEAYGFDANRESVLSGALARFRFLHFSMHGIFDPVHPEQSALVLSLWNRAGRPQNGLLGRADIEGLHLPAELVVLSACETARGRALRGEGLVGFTQRFFAAGAARVVVSLWRVPDSSTAVLMERFYRALFKGGLAPAAALREAQASMWREPRFRAPYHWAGFVLLGEPM